MKVALETFRNAIYSPGETVQISDTELQQFAKNCVVALAVGGEGSRLKAVTESEQVHKTALTLPGGDTMTGAEEQRFTSMGQPATQRRERAISTRSPTST